MKKQREEIAAQNQVLQSIVEGQIPGNEEGTTVSKYDALLALSDLLYLVGDSEEDKKAYLERAKIYEDQWDTVLTTDDISSVQQAAMWYFTNYYLDDGKTHDLKYDKTENTAWLNYTLDGVKYDSLSKYNPTT